MDRLLCSVVLVLLVAYCSSLAIKSDQAEDSKLEQKNDMDMDAKIEDLRNKYETILDQMSKREGQHPFAWGLRRYKTRDHPFSFNAKRDHPFSFRAKKRDHPFSFRAKDHPFSFSLSRHDAGSGEHPFGFKFDGKKDADVEIPSSTQAFHGRRREVMLNDVSDEDIEAARKVSEWLDEKMLNE